MPWISVKDRNPDHKGHKKHKVKVRRGSVKTETIERVSIGRKTVTGFRFTVGDWETVTHWWEEEFISNKKPDCK